MAEMIEQQVKVMRKRAHGLSGDPGVRFTVPSHYGDATIEGRCWWPTFEEAVAAARSKIERFDWGGFSRAFVALRASYDEAPRNISTGADCELMRWEVTPTMVVLDEEGVGFTDELREAAEALPVPEAGWA